MYVCMQKFVWVFKDAFRVHIHYVLYKILQHFITQWTTHY